jgi:uncharacterized protein YdaU (DUF1376 family)
MNYYEHHIGDYAQATSHLTFIEDATYSRLIRKYYATEKPLPSEIKLVQRLINARSKEEKNAVVCVLNEFFCSTDDGWRQDRCDHEIARFKDKQLKARRSAEGRWQSIPTSEILSDSTTASVSNSHANAMQTHSERNAHQTPDTKHQSPVTNLHTPDKQNNAAEKEKHQHFASMISKEGRIISADDHRIKDIVNLGVTQSEVAEAITEPSQIIRQSSALSFDNTGVQIQLA